MNNKCEKCGNDHLFYNEVALLAKQLICNDESYMDGEIVDKTDEVANAYEIVYCYQCREVVDSGELY
ncbi:hypothetical protein [Metasolibacillus sp.]|uniref:hypothetical protein n=1 Tax=Metasolibacillus sp. TaxID=2703680 RepID=UPI0025E8D75A|nr:hypothetical protein [Metasolibacillus sp.]MCT6925295.1 hypothetical protein [Metasolibacillus sp.]MCT6941475.1 hypothetical protein [Metasolibacillus sp.]